MEVGMVDGFHWTRVTSKQLRFLYEEIIALPTPPEMRELTAAIDRGPEPEACSVDRPLNPPLPPDEPAEA
jgi:hypothetical protein